MFGLPDNAYATCINNIQSQAIAAAYEGDVTPTVHTMDTCGGDDTSYQIPIATTITFDGVQYSNIYATTNSVITFGQPDNTFHTYPSTPSISLYSMDWVSGWYNAPDTLNIMYSEGGFQIDLEVIPFGQWGTPQASNINIIVAITNTGGISVAYSYQGPEYQNLRTGVRLHNGDIVSLEAWGATQIQPGSDIPELSAEPISGPITGPTITEEQQQEQIIEATQLASDIANLNNLIALINNEEPVVIPDPEPTTPEEPENTGIDPDVIVEPEVITPEDPRFPDGTEEQNSGEETNLPEDSEITDEQLDDNQQEPTTDTPEEDTNESPIVEPESPEPTVDPSENLDNIPQIDNSIISSSGLSEEELNMLKEQLDKNAALRMAVEQFGERAEENANSPMPYTLADATTEVQAEAFIEAVSVENISAILSNPTEALGAAVENVTELLSNFGELGNDMTDDQREKAQEVIVPVIIASQIAGAVTRRLK